MEIKKMRRLMPSLREKKRYLAFEVISSSEVLFKDISNAIWQAVHELIGTEGAARAGIWILQEKWNQKTQRGIIRVSAKHVNSLRASLAFVQTAGRKKVIIKSVYLSGVLNKAERNMNQKAECEA